MPMGFAVKMYGWTKMGARVVVTPGEMTPSSFSYPLLTAKNPVPGSVASAEKETPSATKSDRGTAADAAITPATSEAAPAIKRDQTQTADATATLPRSGTPATMSDATPSASGPAPVDKTTDASSVGAKPEAANGAAHTAEIASSENKPVETTADEAKTEAKNTDVPKLTDKSDDKAKAATNATVPDLKKDQARSSDADKPAAAKSDPAVAPKRRGQIAVFVSRKDSKLYVRQNFAPLFDVPVTVAASDRPLGTHVFTAEADKDDPKTFHWSVVSLPARHAERRDDERTSRRRKTVGAVEVKAAPVPDSPAEALDRITIPEDVRAKIVDALSTGGSIIISDQGITAGETGEGTDFIVSLR
jgi:hypothetical protein